MLCAVRSRPTLALETSLKSSWPDIPHITTHTDLSYRSKAHIEQAGAANDTLGEAVPFQSRAYNCLRDQLSVRLRVCMMRRSIRYPGAPFRCSRVEREGDPGFGAFRGGQGLLHADASVSWSPARARDQRIPFSDQSVTCNHLQYLPPWGLIGVFPNCISRHRDRARQ